MTRYLMRRLLGVIPVLFAVTLIVFVAMHLIPGDPARVMLGDKAPASEVAAFHHKHHLDQPVLVQLGIFLGGLLHGDLGSSYKTDQPVANEILARYPATMELALAAIVLAVVLGVGLGMLGASRPGTWVDALVTTVSLGGISLPVFWLGLMLILLFSFWMGWLPFSGRLGAVADYQPVTGFVLLDAVLLGDLSLLRQALEHLALPALTLSMGPMAIISRMTRSCLIEVLGADYIRTARAKGLTEAQILWGHALKNALIPVITVIGLEFGTMLGGAVLTETVFQWPGLGRYTVEAILSRDYPVVQGCVLVIALSFVLVNLAVDLLYGFIDPRIRLDGS
ncbi:MAG: ABC transporter permease [Candidatus Xenobia bacterium]